MIATLAAETAIADVKRRGKSNHSYGDRKIICGLRQQQTGTVRRTFDSMIRELVRNADGGRELSVISMREGLPDVLTLISQGYRQIGLADVAAICGVCPRTAQTGMAELRQLGVLGGPRGVKGRSVTSWAFLSTGAKLITSALAHIRSVIDGKASRRAKRTELKHATSADRVTPRDQGRGQRNANPPSPARPDGERATLAPLADRVRAQKVRIAELTDNWRDVEEYDRTHPRQ